MDALALDGVVGKEDDERGSPAGKGVGVTSMPTGANGWFWMRTSLPGGWASAACRIAPSTAAVSRRCTLQSSMRQSRRKGTIASAASSVPTSVHPTHAGSLVREAAALAPTHVITTSSIVPR